MPSRTTTSCNKVITHRHAPSHDSDSSYASIKHWPLTGELFVGWLVYLWVRTWVGSIRLTKRFDLLINGFGPTHWQLGSSNQVFPSQLQPAIAIVFNSEIGCLSAIQWRRFHRDFKGVIRLAVLSQKVTSWDRVRSLCWPKTLNFCLTEPNDVEFFAYHSPLI